MENQAFQLLTVQVEDEWCCRSCQQEFQENYSENSDHLQRLARDVVICPSRNRTTVRTSTRATPYSLAYRMEAMMPLEVEIPSLRVLINFTLEEAEWAKVRYKHLNLINEKRVVVICYHQLYHKRMAKAYDKNV